MKGTSLRIIMYIFIAGFICYSCQPGSSEYRSPAWSSHDPLAIPNWIRQQKYEKGNLVHNPSFETGKWLVVDTLRKSFSIDGWQKVGNNVHWIDLITDTTLSVSEILTGQRAVKIIRTTTDEFVEKGDGIMSNFIRVIPGNYSFSFYTRLLDVRPYSVRLGTRMYDAIDVKLIFYDKNKIQIDSRYLMPYKDQKIDNTFKSLSFANFNHIKTFKWGRIVGKSHSFPFSEGDIPDDSRYVRLYIGLKGTGTMWIDDVDLHFTGANFTPLERFRDIMDSSLTKHDLIIPTPKEITKLESVVFFNQEQGAETLPKIVIPDYKDESLQLAISLLKEKIVHLLEIAGADDKITQNIIVQSSISPDELRQSKLVFSVGKTSLYKKYKDILPIKGIVDHDQGYFVYTSNDMPNVIFLAGNNETGDYYAITTVLQLFDNQYPVLYNARIIDYPDIRQRFFYVNAWQNEAELETNLKTIQKLLLYKLNGAYVGVNLHMPLHFYTNSMKQFDNLWGHSDMFRFMQWITPVFTDSFPMRHSAVKMLHQTTHEKRKYEDLIKGLIDAGQNSYALGMAIAPSFICPEDSTLEYNLSDVLKLTENFRDETQLILRLQQYMHNHYPSGILEYCLPWYNNELVDFSLGYADVYMAAMMNDLDENISFLWSGSSFYTVKTDAADIFRYKKLLGNTPVLMDNSFLTASAKVYYGGSAPYYPRKLRLYNIFEPYGNTELHYYRNMINRDRVFINQAVRSDIEEIMILTALDFYWNMEAYDMDFSLWKVLVSRYGIAAAKELVLFNDALAGILEINLDIEQNDQVNKNYRTGLSILSELKEHLYNITNELGQDNALVIELTTLYIENKNTLNHIYQAVTQSDGGS